MQLGLLSSLLHPACHLGNKTSVWPCGQHVDCHR